MSLSRRAQAAEAFAPKLLLWKVTQDLWDPESNPNGILSLGIAENTLMHESLSEHIRRHLSPPWQAFTYGDGPNGSLRLRNVMSRFLNRHLMPVEQIEPAQITITNGCSPAVEHLSWAFANPGDGFLLGQPYYGTFYQDLSERPGAKLVPVSFHNVDPFGHDAVAKYEETLHSAEADGTRIAGLILCNPHNPLGRCYPRDTVIRLMKLCEKHKIHFISDEIYALSVWENTVDRYPAPVPFESCLSTRLDDIIHPSRVHVIWGMSKDFGANGIRLGAIISQANPSLHTALLPVSLYSSPSSLSEHAAGDILENDAWVESYIAQNRSLLAKHHALAATWANNHGIKYHTGANAAFFLWVDLGSAWKTLHADTASDRLDEVIVEALLHHKVFLASGQDFGSEEPGWFRIVFSHCEDYLLEGLDRVARAIQN